MSEEEELERIRRRKLEALQRRIYEEQQLEKQREVEMKIQAILRQILTPEARQRLANIKMVKPEFARQIEIQLIQLFQRGVLNSPLSDRQLKEILSRIRRGKREIRIRRV